MVDRRLGHDLTAGRIQAFLRHKLRDHATILLDFDDAVIGAVIRPLTRFDTLQRTRVAVQRRRLAGPEPRVPFDAVQSREGNAVHPLSAPPIPPRHSPSPPLLSPPPPPPLPP